MTGITLALFHRHFDKITRRQAFLIHLGFSLVIFIAFAAILIFLWYPGPLFNLEGGWKGIQIVAFVDVVLGPLLTLIVFKPGKPGLKLDMALIISAQIIALSWGIWIVSQARPALIVFANDTFYSVTLSKLKDAGIPNNLSKQVIKSSPSWIYVAIPDDPEKKADLLLETLAAKKNLYLLFDAYRPLAAHRNKVLSLELPILNYANNLPEKYKRKIHTYLNTLTRPQEELAFFPLKSTNKTGVVVIEKNSWSIVDYLAIPYTAELGIQSRQANSNTVESNTEPH